MINDVLDFSKIEAGKLDIEAVPFDLEQTVIAVGELLSAKAEDKELELAIHYAADAPCTVVGDAGQVE